MAGTDEQTLETNVPQQSAQGTNISVATNTDANYADKKLKNCASHWVFSPVVSG